MSRSDCLTSPLTSEARQAVSRLAQGVLAIKPLASVLPGPVRVVVSGTTIPITGDVAAPRAAAAPGEGPVEIVGLDRLLGRVAARLDVPQLEARPGLAMADL